jgi:hypothetical protein
MADWQLQGDFSEPCKGTNFSDARRSHTLLWAYGKLQAQGCFPETCPWMGAACLNDVPRGKAVHRID